MPEKKKRKSVLYKGKKGKEKKRARKPQAKPLVFPLSVSLLGGCKVRRFSLRGVHSPSQLESVYATRV